MRVLYACAMAATASSQIEQAFRVAADALGRFDTRHAGAKCSYVVPEPHSDGVLSRLHPRIVQRLNRECRSLTVTRYAIEWNIGFWFLHEAELGRRYGGRVLEISGESSVRKYLRRSTFVQATYPDVDIMRLDRAYPRESFDMVICESVLEHVANPQLAVLQMHRVLRPRGHMMLMVPAQYPHHFGPHDFWRMNSFALKTLAAPFGSVALCGSHRSSSLARLLTSPDYPSNVIRFYPASDPAAADIVTERPRNTTACKGRRVPRCVRARQAAAAAAAATLAAGRGADGVLPGDPLFGDLVVSSWLIATK